MRNTKLCSGAIIVKKQSYCIHSQMHEGTCVVSGKKVLRFDEPLPPAQLQEKLRLVIKAISDWVAERSGFVGHIKAFVKTKSDSVMLSSTGDDCSVHPSEQWKEHFVCEATLDIAVIVFGVNCAAVEAKLIAALDQVGRAKTVHSAPQL